MKNNSTYYVANRDVCDDVRLFLLKDFDHQLNHILHSMSMMELLISTTAQRDVKSKHLIPPYVPYNLRANDPVHQLAKIRLRPNRLMSYQQRRYLDIYNRLFATPVHQFHVDYEDIQPFVPNWKRKHIMYIRYKSYTFLSSRIGLVKLKRKTFIGIDVVLTKMYVLVL